MYSYIHCTDAEFYPIDLVLLLVLLFLPYNVNFVQIDFHFYSGGIDADRDGKITSVTSSNRENGISYIFLDEEIFSSRNVE